MALGKSLDNILGDYFGEEVVDLKEKKTEQGSQKPSNKQSPTKEKNIGRTLSEGKTVVKDIFIEDIDVSPFQTRKQFDPVKLKTLAESIEKSGLIHPVIVLERNDPKRNEKPFFLIAGERRLRACQELGFELILAVVKSESDLSEEQLALLGAMENLQREDLNPIELANTFEMLMRTQMINETGIAELLNHSTQYIKNYLRLLTLAEPVKRSLENGSIGEGQARHLVGLKEEDQLQFLDLIIQKDLTVREIQELIRKMQTKLKDENKFISQVHNLSMNNYKRAEKLASFFPNSKMKVAGDDVKGKITIQWG
jgi:ParB family transcriptional regulator, chromosome partitioning protein